MASVVTTVGGLAETAPTSFSSEWTLLGASRAEHTQNLQSKRLCWIRVFRSPQHQPQGFG